MSPADLLPAHSGLVVTAVAVTAELIAVAVTPSAPTARCPACGHSSDRVHARYRRTLADLAVGSRRVVLIVAARKFRCEQAGCDRHIFCERLDALAAVRGRTTTRLSDLHRLLGFALGGEPGARVAAELGVPTSPDTLLRRVVVTPDDPAPAYRYVGIDDFALRKGQVYGTLLIDLERGRVIDLLDGRDGTAVETWLKAHPGVEVVTRDRWAAYANAATAGAPQAMQVADRFHLVKNLREVLEKVFEAHAAAVDAALKAQPADPLPPEVIPTSTPEPTPQPPSPRRQRRVDRFEHVRRLRAVGKSIRGIARELRMSVKTVCRYLRQDRCPDWNPGAPRPTGVDRFTEAVDEYIRAGGRQASEVFRTLQSRGCRVGYNGVRRFFNRRLAAAGVERTRVNAACPPPARPSFRQLSFEYVRRAEKRTEEATTRMAAVGGVTAIADELRLVDEFLGMVRQTAATPLAEWLSRAERSSSSAVRSFAASLRSDEVAVRAGLSTGWSNGPVEGQVGRLKLIKRQMYGRAGFRLLRARVRHKP